jgi:hypothetical protein
MTTTIAEAQARHRRKPGVREAERARSRARGRAMTKLIARYPDEFRKLYVKECKAAGVILRPAHRPTGTGRNGAR